MADLASLLRVSAGSVLIRTPYLFLDVAASGVYLTKPCRCSEARRRRRDGGGSSATPECLICRLEGTVVNGGSTAFNLKNRNVI